MKTTVRLFDDPTDCLEFVESGCMKPIWFDSTNERWATGDPDDLPIGSWREITERQLINDLES